jgi:hypothetical protein
MINKNYTVDWWCHALGPRWTFKPQRGRRGRRERVTRFRDDEKGRNPGPFPYLPGRFCFAELARKQDEVPGFTGRQEHELARILQSRFGGSPPKSHVDVCSCEAQYFPRPSPPGTFD